MQDSVYSKPSSGFAHRISGNRGGGDARSSGGFQSVFSASVNENKYIAQKDLEKLVKPDIEWKLCLTDSKGKDYKLFSG